MTKSRRRRHTVIALASRLPLKGSQSRPLRPTVGPDFMLVYWAMFAVPALSAFLGDAQQPGALRRQQVGLGLLLLAFVILVGARYEVGGDWFAYEEIVEFVRHEKLSTSLEHGDPGFQIVTWVMTRLGFGSVGPSSFCGAILIYGIWRFIKPMPDPWLALTAAVPYLIIVVGMGYVRQGAAIGFILLAILQFEQSRWFHFCKWFALAVMFHVSSLAVLPIAALVIVRKQPLAFVPVAIAGATLYALLLAPRMDRLYNNYIVAEYDSSGALVRLAMNAVPAVLFLVLRKRFSTTDTARAWWALIALLSLFLVVLVLTSPATTALDRIGLYCIPIQLFVFGNLSTVCTTTVQGRRLLTFSVITYYAAAMFIWLNYATHSSSWIPYRFQPLA